MSAPKHIRGTPTQIYWTRGRIHVLSRTVICLVFIMSLGTLFLKPSSVPQLIVDVLLRTYLIFIGTVMAHEGVHGHLGRTKAANFWWGRIALIPSMVPYTNFRKTHRLHHAYTNIPDQDPDHFLKSRSVFEIPFRAIAMPHQWFFWLYKRGRIGRDDLKELTLNYFAIFATHGVIFAIVGPTRMFWGMFPALILVSLLLWYPFAIQTHEGYSTGSAKSRSHNYYGHFMYWFSLGLSIHREHHVQPRLAWIELKPYVQDAPAELKRRLLPQRDKVDALPLTTEQGDSDLAFARHTTKC